jgi:hypothetical protein
MKLIANQAYENMGLASSQLLRPVLDGLMCNTPEAHRIIELARREGVGAAASRRSAAGWEVQSGLKRRASMSAPLRFAADQCGQRAVIGGRGHTIPPRGLPTMPPCTRP